VNKERQREGDDRQRSEHVAAPKHHLLCPFACRMQGCWARADRGRTRTSQNVTLHEAAHHTSKCKCHKEHCEHFAENLIKLYEITDTLLPQSSKFPTVRALLAYARLRSVQRGSMKPRRLFSHTFGKLVGNTLALGIGWIIHTFLL